MLSGLLNFYLSPFFFSLPDVLLPTDLKWKVLGTSNISCLMCTRADNFRLLLY